VVIKQESLANAKVTGRQPSYIRRPKMPTSAEFQENLNL